MADEPENLLLVYLRRIDQRQERMEYDLREVKDRLTAQEFGQSTVIRLLGALTETDARLQAGLDRLRDDVDRINRRLDIGGASA